MDYDCPDCHLNVIFADSTCTVTGKYHANKPVQVQHYPMEHNPPYTIDDPDLNELLNETHWMSVGMSQGIGSVDQSIAWIEALDRVMARLKDRDPEYTDPQDEQHAREDLEM